ncbi:MAG: helix-turn-helix domain-containing protein [Deltaproteobacteria bacterium]|nr:helix-turn-helix domain-containing protein [Deltaproteobacteria bacterium]MBI3387967.1 helix-turn-helix domain-containing protein [Deltaproteobacteria bacterium]
MGRKKRNLFDELMTGVGAMRAHREGKVTLRTHQIEAKPLPRVSAALVRDTRERLNMSQRVFAWKLRINPRTLERWEHGRSAPNEQAAALILLVRRFPDTLDRLDRIAAPPRSRHAA